MREQTLYGGLLFSVFLVTQPSCASRQHQHYIYISLHKCEPQHYVNMTFNINVSINEGTDKSILEFQ